MMAISVAVPVGEKTADLLIEKLAPRVEALKIGPYTDGNDVDFGPLVTEQARDRVLGLVNSGVEQGAKLVVDGRGLSVAGYENGHFLGPTLFDRVTRDMSIYRDEIFGPVLVVVRADSDEDAIDIVNQSPYGNGTAVFTQSGAAARRFANEVQVGMVGINVPIPVPMAFFSFGGWKNSLFGDLHMHGPDGVRFYTRTKVVTTRWPEQRDAVSLSMPTMR